MRNNDIVKIATIRRVVLITITAWILALFARIFAFMPLKSMFESSLDSTAIKSISSMVRYTSLFKVVCFVFLTSLTLIAAYFGGRLSLKARHMEEGKRSFLWLSMLTINILAAIFMIYVIVEYCLLNWLIRQF